MEAGCNCEPFWWIERINAILSLSPHFRVGVCFDTVRESACMACKRSAVRSRYSPPKRHCTVCAVSFFFLHVCCVSEKQEDERCRSEF